MTQERWRILKKGVQLHNLLHCDMVWLICCALHNYLLDVDGFSDRWDDGVCVDSNTSDKTEELPFAIRKLMNPITAQVFDFSGMGMGNDCEVDDDSTSILEEEIATTDAVKKSGRIIKCY